MSVYVRAALRHQVVPMPSFPAGHKNGSANIQCKCYRKQFAVVNGLLNSCGGEPSLTFAERVVGER
jgi:hypothetical protein